MLRAKYFLLFTRLKNPKERVLEFLPFILAKSVLFIFEEKFNETLDEIFGIFGHSQQCNLFVYQFVAQLFSEESELQLTTVDKLI